MTIHSMNVYLDDIAFEELKLIEARFYKTKESKARNRSDVFTELIHSYLTERTNMIARINHLEAEAKQKR